MDVETNFNECQIIADALALFKYTYKLMHGKKERRRDSEDRKMKQEGTSQTVEDDKDGHLKYKRGDWLNSRCINIFLLS